MDTMRVALESPYKDEPDKKLNITDYDNIIADLFEEIISLPPSKRITIASVMTRDVIILDHTKTAYDAASVMKEKSIGSVIITAYGKPFGIVTERDLARIVAFLNIPAKSLILSFLASRPLICARPTQTIQEASDIMGEYNIDHIPILEKDRIVGMVTTRDIAMYLLYA
jgi:signal-transduction protein with cAMP-binding, CBS, and nucleotidyltransferase domain